MNVWAGIIFDVEFMFVNYIVFATKFITQTGVSIKLVPVIVAHEVELDPIEISLGNRILILPVELKGSFILIENVYDVILLTISEPLPVKDPVKEVATAVKDWYPTCMGNPFLKILILKLAVGYVDGGAV